MSRRSWRKVAAAVLCCAVRCGITVDCRGHVQGRVRLSSSTATSLLTLTTQILAHSKLPSTFPLDESGPLMDLNVN